MAVKLQVSALLVAACVAIATASGADVPNWVNPINTTKSACYRKTYLSSKTCATGYGSDGIAACWAQCPLDFPVECGVECIPQSSDCTSNILDKVTSVATVALNAATAGVFGELIKAGEALQFGVKCGQALFAATSSLVSYVDELKAKATQSEQLMSVVNQSDLVINELPSAISTCLGLPVSTETLALSAEVVNVVNQVVTEVVNNGASLLDPSTFLAFMSSAGVDDSVQDLDTNGLAQLEDILTAGTTCGTKLQAITHKATQFVAAMTEDSTNTANLIRQALSDSDLFLKDIPSVTNNCVRNLTDDAFSVRDSLRAVMGTIMDGLVDKAVDDDGNAISKSEYLMAVADMGLDVIAMFDPTGIARMMSTFIQPICGPTTFVGEIDDGSLADALALTVEGQAFSGSYGTWSQIGDGTVSVIFISTDTKDVTVVIHSGGDTIAEVDVASGTTVSWNSTVKDLQDKTLYFDRWRPGLLDVPRSNGGSLLMWVPRSSAGGEIKLYVKINGDGADDSDDDNRKTGIEQKTSEAASGGEDSVTPAPTPPEDEDQTQQTPTFTEDGVSSALNNKHAATPAPTSLHVESETPAPTTVDTDPVTDIKQGHNSRLCNGP